MLDVKASLLLLISAGLYGYSQPQVIRTFFHVMTKLNWTQAVDQCSKMDSVIASILNSSENNRAKPSAGKSWTGMIRAWTWALEGDSQRSDSHWVLHWRTGEPRENENCTALGTSEGKWVSKSCITKLKYASCYSDSDQMHHIVEGSMDWGQARTLCRTNFTDLSSARNNTQIQAILTAFKNLTGSTTSSTTSFTTYSITDIWIGLTWRWMWWNQNPNMWSGWAQDPDDPVKGCMVVESDGKWSQEECDKLHETVCLKRVPVEEGIKRTKVKLRLNPGSADLSDPVVQQSLLNQIAERLQKSGVTGVKLSLGQCKKESSKAPSSTDCVLKVHP